MMCFKSVLCVQECALWKKTNRKDDRETNKQGFIVKSEDIRTGVNLAKSIVSRSLGYTCILK